MEPQFKGIYPALITPYDANGKVDFTSLRYLVSKLIADGADGFFVNGTTSEMLNLSLAERKDIITCVCETAAKRVVVIAQIYDMSTSRTIKFADYSLGVGCDAICSVPPLYFRLRDKEVVKFFQELNDQVDAPFLLYDYPNCTGRNLLSGAYEEIFHLSRFAGLKESSFNFEGVTRFKDAFPDKSLLFGTDECLLKALRCGADGAVGSTYNVMMKEFKSLFEFFKKGNYAEAEKIQEYCNGLIDVLNGYSGLPALKHYINKNIIACGGCREPLRQLSETEKNEIDLKTSKYLGRMINYA